MSYSAGFDPTWLYLQQLGLAQQYEMQRRHIINPAPADEGQAGAGSPSPGDWERNMESTGKCADAREATPIEVEMSLLRVTIVDLQTSIGALAQRVDPVLRTNRDDTPRQIEPASPSPGESILACALQSCRNDIRGQVFAIRNLVDRIEI